jgi:hypothetical protein
MINSMEELELPDTQETRSLFKVNYSIKKEPATGPYAEDDGLNSQERRN